ncbi:MAG: methyltransferase domain-containing protein [Oscillatoriaceae cyanobacterium Prado104]|jgi:ubiquinone/menaquinone biosynthesis C-methylase UbiE|nr:methyltransferase domain-containing protein [Oscillatoriaceae cyanobacterium Prado104]
MTEQSSIKIRDVAALSVEDSDLLWGYNIDSPRNDLEFETDKIFVYGWILGKKNPAVAIKVTSGGTVIQQIATNNPRPDVAKIYSTVVGSENCGFSAEVGVDELPEECELVLEALFSDQSSVPIAVVKFQQKLPRLKQIQADLKRSRTRLQQIQSELEQHQPLLHKTQEQLQRLNSQKYQTGKQLQALSTMNISEELANHPPKTNVSSKPEVVACESTNAAILTYGCGMSDRQWFETLVKSLDRSIVDSIEMPGFPAEELQRQFVGTSGQAALNEAFNFYSQIKQYAGKLGLKLGRDSRILDFGCGWGRIIRFFLKDVAAENLYGIDVDSEMTDICIKTVRHGNYSAIKPLPPLEFSEGSFDIVYAYSVFSHLAEPVQIKWVEEFSRILKPGGIFLATTQARSFIELCRTLRNQSNTSNNWYHALAHSFVDTEAALADYDSGKFLYSATGGGGPRDASFYGEAVIPPEYVKREWTKYFALCDFVDDPAVLTQALIVMQKPV